MKVVLGVDTSNYMTSICLVDLESGYIVQERRQLLKVEKGKKGLQQSAALFQHLQNLPTIMEKFDWTRFDLAAIGVSSQPRPQEKSYMPVFKAGEGFARSWAAMFGVSLYLTSHQEGHLAAGEGTAVHFPKPDSFLAIHLSGGTSELLKVERHESGYNIKKLGGTRDVHAGQFVDRVGVALGLPFPSGPELELLANQAQGMESFSLPSSVQQYDFSFAGPETAAQRAIAVGNVPKEVLARSVEQCIVNTLEKVIRLAIQNEAIQDVLIVGGVAANRYIRERLRQRLEHPAVKARLYFANPSYSGDNAFGVALLARQQLNKTHKNTNDKR